MKLLIIAFAFLLSWQAFADAQLSVQGLNDDILLRSPAGIQIGIKFSDGVVANPSFSLNDLRNGIVEKTIYEEDRSIVSCMYNWLFLAQSDDFSPRNFQGVSDGVCRVLDGNFVIDSPAVIRHVVVTVEKSAFDSLTASHLILTITAEDLVGSTYPQKIQQVSVNQTPSMFEKTFVQIVNSDLNFILNPLWMRSSGNLRGDPISFQEDEFILE